MRDRLSPEGATDNSPPFQRRVNKRKGKSPRRGRMDLLQFRTYVACVYQLIGACRIFNETSKTSDLGRDAREALALYRWHCARKPVQGFGGWRNARPCACASLSTRHYSNCQSCSVDQRRLFEMDQRSELASQLRLAGCLWSLFHRHFTSQCHDPIYQNPKTTSHQNRF